MSDGCHPPFLFVVGYGRSGTTLLVALLDSHPAMAIPGETGGIIPTLCEKAEQAAAGFDLDGFVDDVLGHKRIRLWGLDPAALRATLYESAASNGPDAVRALYRFYAAARGKTMYGDKTPKHVLRLADLARYFPEARFIHLIRDGRNAALAMVEASFGPDTVAAVAGEWKVWVEAGRATGRELGPAGYLEVRYEALIDEPARTLRSITDFVGIPFSEMMLNKEEAARRQVAMSPEPGQDRSLLLPMSPTLRDWRASMSKADVAAFKTIAGDVLESLGYSA